MIQYLTITAGEEGGRAVVRAVGELDMNNADALRARLFDALAGGPVTLDLTGLTYMDSLGMKLLLDAHRLRPDADALTILLRRGSGPDRVLSLSRLAAANISVVP